jgi:hypothetical protein
VITALLVILAGLAVLTYVVGPILVKFSSRSSAHPSFTALDPSHLPLPVAQYMGGVVGVLQEDGFVPQAYLNLPNQVANVNAFMLLMQNREVGDQAGIFALLATSDGLTRLKTPYVEFSTKFASGRSFDTNNAGQLNAFTPPPGRTITQLPDVQDVGTLYRLHRYIMAKAAEAEGGEAAWGAHKLYPPGPEGHARALAEGMRDSYEVQVRMGVLHPTPGGDAYLPTWPGAFKMTWGLLPPMNWLRRSALKKRGEELLARMQRDTAAESWAERKRGAGL